MGGYNLGEAEGRITINTDDLGNTVTNLRRTGDLFHSFGSTLVGGFTAAVTASANFETQISIVKAVTGETGVEIDRLTEKALELGRKGPFGPTQVAAAFAELSKAGLTATEIIDGAGEAVISLAKAGDISVPRAAEIMANVMRTFNIEAKDSVKVVDLLAGAANQSTLEIEDLAVSLKYAGGIAAALKIPIGDVAIALAELGNAGIKGSTGGTSLRQILLSLSPSTKPATEALKELGIITKDGSNQFYDSAGNAKSLKDVIDILAKATAGLTNEQKVSAFQTIFGNRAAAAALILTEQGAAGWDNMAASIAKVSAADVAATKLDNLNGSMRRFKAALEAVLIGAGGPFQNVLQPVVEFATKMLLAFDKLPGPLKTTAVALIAVVGGLSLLAGAAFLTLAPIVSMVSTFSKLPATLATVRAGFSALSGAFSSLSGTLLANPIFLIIAAIILLGIALYELYQHSEKFRNFVDGLWQTIQVVWDKILGFFKKLPDYFREAWQAIKDAFSEGVDWIKQNWDILLAVFTGPIGLIVLIIRRFGDDIKAGFKDAVDGVINFFKDLPDRIIGYVQSLLDWLQNNWAKAIGAILLGPLLAIPALIDKIFGTDILGTISRAIEAIVGFFTALPGRILGILDSMTSSVLNFFQALPGQVANFMGQALQAFGDFLQQFPYLLGYAIGAMIGLSIKFWLELLQFTIEGGAKILFAVGDFLGKLPGFFIGIFTTVVQYMVDFVTGMVALAVDLGVRFINSVIQFLSQLPGAILGIITTIIANVVQFVSDMVALALDLGARFLSAVINFFAQLPGRIKAFWDFIWAQTVDFVEAMVNLAISLGTRFISAVISFFQSLPGYLKSIWDNIWSSTVDFVESMFQLAVSLGTRFLGAVVNFFSQVPGAILNALGDVGNLLWNAGVRIMEGFLGGLKSLAGSVKDFFGGLTKGITSWKGPEDRDKKLLRPAAGWIMGGFLDELNKNQPMIQDFFTTLTGSIGSVASKVNPSFSGAGVSNNLLSNITPTGGVPTPDSTSVSTAPVTVNNTFTGSFQVRDDRDALQISRYLAEETRRTLIFQGVGV